jgi:F-type H+-transporting ATPase subunit epsilon
MYLEIVSPEATLFSGEVTSVAVPGVDGAFQMLNMHAPIVSILEQGVVKIKGDFTIDKQYQSKFKKGEHNETLLEVQSGVIEMRENKVIILADS